MGLAWLLDEVLGAGTFCASVMRASGKGTPSNGSGITSCMLAGVIVGALVLKVLASKLALIPSAFWN
jgi:hypothetical protein